MIRGKNWYTYKCELLISEDRKNANVVVCTTITLKTYYCALEMDVKLLRKKNHV